MASRKLWEPSDSFVSNSNLSAYLRWLERNKSLFFDDYKALWEWSVTEIEAFWQSIWEYFDVNSSYTTVLAKEQMPGAKWFENARVNYAQEIFDRKNSAYPALIYKTERKGMEAYSWEELEDAVAACRDFLVSRGIEKGDCVVGFVANIPEATIAFLACCSLGAIWSSCSPDFGVNSVVERFRQIAPKLIFAVNGYSYNNKAYPKTDIVVAICSEIDSIRDVVWIDFLDEVPVVDVEGKICHLMADVLSRKSRLEFTPVGFDHPIWVLYSSGTTGNPKAITHSHGGMLVEHLKYLAFHNDVKPGERFFWFATTGWMMWNFVQASLLLGATAVLYDGSPSYPDLMAMWRYVEEAGITHFGTSAPFLVACMRQGLQPKALVDLSCMRSIGSTGSPLPPEAFDWVYDAVKEDLWLCSMSGGTDVCTAFVGGCPERPIYEGSIQCRALGVSLYAYDDQGRPIEDALGEMVITRPMPSMPVFFWNDKGGKRYLASYFEYYPGVWRHGDWIIIDRNDQLRIVGRSDATLNRQGVRIGTSEIYNVLDKLDVVEDSLIVNLELDGGEHLMPLFVKLKRGYKLDGDFEALVKRRLKFDCSPRHVPDKIIQVGDIPYTISGKKMEAPIKRILLRHPVDDAINRDAMRNPECVEEYVAWSKKLY